MGQTGIPISQMKLCDFPQMRISVKEINGYLNSTIDISSPLMPKATLGGVNYFSQFPDEETEGPRSSVCCSKSKNW